MKKTVLSLLAAFFVLSAPAQKVIELPQPDMSAGVTLMEALKQRHSERSFDKRDVDLQALSQILWAACGINRPESGKITAPSAINAQDIVVFVCTKNGAYLYEPLPHRLVEVSAKDLRKSIAGFQSFAADAPVSLVLASDHKKFGDRQKGASRMGLIDSGYVSENISLMCTALGMSTVPRMTMDTDVLKQELGLDETYDLILNHPVGYPAK